MHFLIGGSVFKKLLHFILCSLTWAVDIRPRAEGKGAQEVNYFDFEGAADIKAVWMNTGLQISLLSTP